MHTLGVATPASPKAKTAGAVAGTAQALATDQGSSAASRVVLLAVLGLSALLILAALVPLNFEFVPYRLAMAWHDRRVALVLLGGSLLVLEGVLYLVLHS